MAVGVFEMFKLGVSLSSSHTVEPICTLSFLQENSEEGFSTKTEREVCELMGGLVQSVADM